MVDKVYTANERENPAETHIFLVADEDQKVTESGVVVPRMKVWDHCGTTGTHLEAQRGMYSDFGAFLK